MFNIIGWIWRKTRKIHLASIAITLFSWLILGIWYGMGYCICTDWHWQVRAQLGETIESASYIHFLIKEITGISLNESLVDYSVILIFLASIFLSVFLFIKDIKAKKRGLFTTR